MLSLGNALVASFFVIIIFSYISIVLSLISNGCRKYVAIWAIVLFQISLTRPFLMPFTLRESREDFINKYLNLLKLSKRKHNVAIKGLMKSRRLYIYFLAYSMKSFFINFDGIFQTASVQIGSLKVDELITKTKKNKIHFNEVGKGFVDKSRVSVFKPIPRWETIIKEDLLEYNNSRRSGNFC